MRSPWRELLLFGVMVLGMAGKYFWDLIERRRESRRAKGSRSPKLQFDWLDFLQPLLISGIVFAGVLREGPHEAVGSVLFSFQNGFFWQTVLKRTRR